MTLKQRLAWRKKPVRNAASLPFVDWLRAQKAAGRPLWLCTAADARLAQAVADHLGIFDGVLASNGRTNLSGRHKAAELVARFGERGFDYCGNHPVDVPIWAQARSAIVVNAPESVRLAASQVTVVSHVVPAPPVETPTMTPLLPPSNALVCLTVVM